MIEVSAMVQIADGISVDSNGTTYDINSIDFEEGKAYPVLLEFNEALKIGEVVLKKEGDTIFGDFQITDPVVCDKLREGIRHYPATGMLLHGGDEDAAQRMSMMSVGLSPKPNADPRIPPLS